jgi:nitrogen fixation-related uncharacterized protein
MTKYMSLTPPWEDIKRWALESGFYDDGYGEPRCQEWDDLRRFADRVAADAAAEELEACIEICRMNDPEGFATHLLKERRKNEPVD